MNHLYLNVDRNAARLLAIMMPPFFSFVSFAKIKKMPFFFRSHTLIGVSALLQAGAPFARDPWGRRTVTNWLLDALSMGLIAFGMKYTNLSFRTKCIMGVSLFLKQVAIANLKYRTIDDRLSKGATYSWLTDLTEEELKEDLQKTIGVTTTLFKRCVKSEKKRAFYTTRGYIATSWSSNQERILKILDLRLDCIERCQNKTQKEELLRQHITLVDENDCYHLKVFEGWTNLLTSEYLYIWQKWEMLSLLAETKGATKPNRAMLEDIKNHERLELTDKLKLYKLFFKTRYCSTVFWETIENWVKEEEDLDTKAKVFVALLEMFGTGSRQDQKKGIQQMVQFFNKTSTPYWEGWKEEEKNKALYKKLVGEAS